MHRIGVSGEREEEEEEEMMIFPWAAREIPPPR